MYVSQEVNVSKVIWQRVHGNWLWGQTDPGSNLSSVTCWVANVGEVPSLPMPQFLCLYNKIIFLSHRLLFMKKVI